MRRKTFVLALIVAVLLTMTVGALSVSADGHHPSCKLHKIRYGETLYSIGRLYGVNPYSIAQANNLWNPNYIQGGAYLCIPSYGAYGHGYYDSYYGHEKVDGYTYDYYDGYGPYGHKKVNGYTYGYGYPYGHAKVDGYRYYPYQSYYGYGY